jgi:type VI secretion system secreted protein Hcp
MPIYMGIFTKGNVLDKRFRGDVTARGYEGWIELQSAQLGQMRRVGAVGTTNQPAQPVQEIVITKLQDSASNALFREAIDGREGRLVVIHFVKGEETSMRIVLQGVMIGSFGLSGPGADGPRGPTESFSLNFTKITFDASSASPTTTQTQLYKLSQQSTEQAN